MSPAMGSTYIGASGRKANGPIDPLRDELLDGVDVAAIVRDPPAGEASSVRGVEGDCWDVVPSALAPTTDSTPPLLPLSDPSLVAKTWTVDTGASAKASSVVDNLAEGFFSPVASSTLEGDGGTENLPSPGLALIPRLRFESVFQRVVCFVSP